jgi:DNA-binding transcriptional LysR family regulator
MELRQLRYLVAVADERSFTRAAMKCNVAQPALSQQIAKLERELGAALVHRRRTGAELSEAGRLVVARGRGALEEVAAIHHEVGELTGLHSGTVRLGITPTTGPLNVARLIADFHRRHPRVDVVVSEDLSSRLVEQLRTRTIDVAFISGLEARERVGLDVTQLAQEPLVAIVPPSHRLANRRRVRLEELHKDVFATFTAGATIRRSIQGAATARGFAVDIRFEAGDVTRIRALVAEGLAVSVLPRTDAIAPGPPVTALELVAPRLRYAIFAAHRDDRTPPPAVAALLRDVRPR